MLLVEDEPEVRKVVRMQLTGLGHAVIEAADGVEALGLLQHVDDIALLVSDTVMPGGIGGRELARRARALRAPGSTAMRCRPSASCRSTSVASTAPACTR